MRDARGVTLLEIVVALALGSIVVGLVGSIFVASFATWRRGAALRDAQVETSSIVDLFTRDVRVASRTAGIHVAPALTVDAGTPLVALATGDQPASGDGVPLWIVYVYDETRRELRRLLATIPDGHTVEVRASRLVGTGVRRVEVAPAGEGALIEVEVRKERSASVMRGRAVPRNP